MDAITLGIDLATASARCVALDTATGAVLATATAPLPRPVRSRGGVSRQRSDYAPVAFTLISDVCRELGSGAARVRALSLTGTSGTVVPCAGDASPIGDARLYDDSSASAELGARGMTGASSLGRMLSLEKEFRVTGRGRPELMLSTVDVVGAALVGTVVASDTSHALKAGIDLARRSWPEDAMASLGLRTTRLPGLVPPGQVLGTVSRPTAAVLGLPEGVVVVAGMTDGCTAQISTGSVHPGDTMGVLGTTLVVKGVSAVELTTADGAVYSHLSPSGDFWPGGASNSGAGVLDTEFAGRDLSELDRAAATRGPSTVVRYPLARVGERFPVADLTLRSVATGEPVDEVDAYRAVLEGVAFVERLAVETLAGLGIRPTRHTLTGGASRSGTWNTIRATVLAPVLARGVVPALAPGPPRFANGQPREPAVVHAQNAGSAVGAAILAAHALAASRATSHLTETVDRLVPAPHPVAPDPTTAGRLEQSYGTFVALLDPGHRPGPLTSTAEQSVERRPRHV
jgi:xylulokinase